MMKNVFLETYVKRVFLGYISGLQKIRSVKEGRVLKAIRRYFGSLKSIYDMWKLHNFVGKRK